MKQPAHIHWHRSSKRLAFTFAERTPYWLSAEFLRVHSQSAAVKGHGQPKLQHGKLLVDIAQVDRVGHYGLRLRFSDGHDSGIYRWDYLYDLCQHRREYWHKYLHALHTARLSRDPNIQIVQICSAPAHKPR